MKIRDLNLNQYVVVKDLGAGKYSSGMRVIGKVIKIDDKHNYAIIESLPKHRYEITDFNDFELWAKNIEDKTESVSDSKGLSGFTVDEKLLEEAKEKGIDELRRNMLQSNDVQQRKRNKKIVQWSDDIKMKFIERVIQDLSPLPAYHIGNAIDVLAVAESKEDIEQARWSIQRAYENWD
ncbi:hypothetical protein NGC87_06200 [Staphylococcus pseudoxylosus]|uniref:hypothetical protein n=1 Tax=Staphylococcus pseudoxylosus TaxID=2282419 RepID=UPI002DB8292B|nr:hypothetical protein [Staphylococcus pseudoxylosus]MEB7763914.1 hypothetical protein [Staphylococcus pseudoxylosus]